MPTRPAARPRAARRQPTLLLLGSGELGKEFVICAKRLGCRVVAVDRYDDAPAITQLRVLTEQATAGTWAADTSSPLWGVVVGAALDISRERNNFRAGDPLLQASFAVLPTSTPVTRAPCPADLNLDGQVDGADLALLLGDWGADGFGDLDRNDTVDGADLGVLLAAWGPCA